MDVLDRIFDSFEDFERISCVWDLCQVFEKVMRDGKNVYVTENRYFAMILEFQGEETEEDFIIVRGIEKENSSVLFCSVHDEEKCKSIRAEDIKIKLKFYDYGPVEKKSATAAEYIEQCVAGAVFKKSYLGCDLLNSAEKKLAYHSGYIYLLTSRDYLKYTDTGLFGNAKNDIPEGASLAAAFDEYMKENCGIRGRINRKKLKKEIEKHIAEDFDESYFVSLCKEAVKDYETAFCGGEKYDEAKRRVTALLKDKGFCGEYPVFERADGRISFGVDTEGDGWELYARFGTYGEKKKKYRNFVTGSDVLTVPCLNCEDFDMLEVCICDAVNIIEGKAVSEKFRSHTTQASVGKLDKGLGIYCMIFGACTFALTVALACAHTHGFIRYFTDSFVQILGLLMSIVLIAYGIILTSANKRGRYLASDKGEKI